MSEIRELLKETLDPNGHPSRLLVQWEPFEFVMNEPLMKFCRGNRARGTTTRDRWGTLILFPEDAPGAMPHVTEDERVLHDVCDWESVKVPDLDTPATEPGAWDDALALQDEIRARGNMSIVHFGTGIFEQAHFLLGMEDTMCAPLEEPEATHDYLQMIADWRFHYVELLVEYMHPDAINSHDDWGSKESLFNNPEVWREFYKPLYQKIYDYLKENDVLIIHHADSYCEPIVPDMIDLGIDIWQGCLNTNNITKLQKESEGKITLMGGIDSIIDRADQTEEEIRAETRKVCETWGPGGHFIPSLTSGLKNAGIFPLTDKFIDDEIRCYNRDVYGC